MLQKFAVVSVLSYNVLLEMEVSILKDCPDPSAIPCSWPDLILLHSHRPSFQTFAYVLCFGSCPHGPMSE